MALPSFPDFVPLTMELKNEILPKLYLAQDGVSEFSFAGLYLFRKRYQYRISRLEDKTLIISGIQPTHKSKDKPESFFMTPCASPGRGILKELFKTHNFWKNIPESIIIQEKKHLEEFGMEITEDRDNFDYLYLRPDLAELRGKKFHKKRNLVAQFNKLYVHKEIRLSAELIPDALFVLEEWNAEKDDDADYMSSREALELFEELKMEGLMFYINDKPVGWCLGEAIARGRIFTVHFEKGLERFKGIYQFINQAFAAKLPESVIYINREQDLGNEGLRQAKMTYRPSSFVRKYTGRLTGSLKEAEINSEL